MATDGVGDRRLARLRATAVFLQRALAISVLLNLVFLVLLVRGCLGRSMARAILIDGKPVCLVRSERAAHQVHEALLAAKQGAFRGKVALKQRWEDRPQSAKGEKVFTIEEAVAALKPRVDVLVQGFAIRIEGRDIVVLPTQEQAEETLRGVKAKFLSDGETPLEPQTFEKPPVVVPVQVAPDLLVSDLRTATEALLQGTTEPEEYVVKTGDTPHSVAQAHYMTVARLYKLNAGLEQRARSDNIQPGEKWTVAASRPRLVVLTRKETTRTAPIPFRTLEEPRDTLPSGTVQVVQAGQPGERKEWVRATWRNDQLVPESVKVVRTKVLRPPQDKRVLKGIRPTVPETPARR